MKKYLLMFIAAFAMMIPATSTAAVSEFKYMTFTFADGTQRSFSLAGFKITNKGDSMVISNSEETYTVLKSQVASMSFTEEPTAVKSAKTSGTAIIYRAGSIEVKTVRAARLRIIAADGTIAVSADVKAGSTTVDTSRLPAGAYVVSVDGYTHKLLKK